MSKVPSRGPNSPFSVGNRTLLARTCTRCGVLADGDSFPLLNKGTHKEAHRKVCHDCFNAQKKRDREERGIGVPLPRPPEEQQSNRKLKWETEDDEYLREHIDTQSYEEMAVALGRSLNAVYTRRSILGLSKVRKYHRVEKPWKIT